jgi:DNA processing protein
MWYRYWLAGIRPLSDRKKIRLCQEYGSARGVYNIEEMQLYSRDYLSEKDVCTILDARKNDGDTLTGRIKETWEKWNRQGIQIVTYEDSDYPKRLRTISDPPYALYVKGHLPDGETPVVAIVGARRCTTYGEEMALIYGEKLARAGVQVLSGMAKGIDGAAQRGALNGGGKSYAVLGSGVDVCYPREHIGLYMDLQKQGGILSEQPPGEPPLPAYFPQRNRIISGLADVVIIIEAKERSGSLITADCALEQGKDVYALPGPVTSPMSSGCHRLIRQGAGILLSPEDLLMEMGIGYGKNSQKSVKNKKVLESTENIVYSCLDLFPKGIQQLVEETGLEPKTLLDQLITLELRGKIREVSKNYYIKTRPL